jgi:hypothetical protein
MPKRREDEREHNRRHEHERERGHEHEREREREDIGDDPQRHTEIIARRWLGSPPPTFDRIARALRQWSALRGAVVPPAPDVADDEEKKR